MKRSWILALALTCLAAVPARAQSGLYAGVQWTGASLTYKGAAESLDFGSGFGLHAGLNVGSAFGVLVNYDKNTLSGAGSDTDLGQWDLLARLTFFNLGPAHTYITGGLTGRTTTSRMYNGQTGNFDFSGMNPTAGLTAQMMLTSKIAVDGGVLWTFGRFNETTGYSTSRVEATGSRVSVGVSYFLFGGR